MDDTGRVCHLQDRNFGKIGIQSYNKDTFPQDEKNALGTFALEVSSKRLPLEREMDIGISNRA